MKSDGTRNVWKYIHIVARNPGAVLSRNRKTELRTTLDKCTYTEYLKSVVAPMRTHECDPSYLKRTTIPRRIWVMKHRHGMTGTGKIMQLWGYMSTQKCPRCRHRCETAAHVTMCTAPLAIEQWKTSLEMINSRSPSCASQQTHIHSSV
jgi:hypothetical protein